MWVDCFSVCFVLLFVLIKFVLSFKKLISKTRSHFLKPIVKKDCIDSFLNQVNAQF